jgi:hypothetical protein
MKKALKSSAEEEEEEEEEDEAKEKEMKKKNEENCKSMNEELLNNQSRGHKKVTLKPAYLQDVTAYQLIACTEISSNSLVCGFNGKELSGADFSQLHKTGSSINQNPLFIFKENELTVYLECYDLAKCYGKHVAFSDNKDDVNAELKVEVKKTKRKFCIMSTKLIGVGNNIVVKRQNLSGQSSSEPFAVPSVDPTNLSQLSKGSSSLLSAEDKSSFPSRQPSGEPSAVSSGGPTGQPIGDLFGASSEQSSDDEEKCRDKGDDNSMNHSFGEAFMQDKKTVDIVKKFQVFYFQKANAAEDKVKKSANKNKMSSDTDMKEMILEQLKQLGKDYHITKDFWKSTAHRLLALYFYCKRTRHVKVRIIDFIESDTD